MIRTLLFDLGNVLLPFSHTQMCAQIGALCDRSAAEIRDVLLNSGLQWDFERGRLSEGAFHRRLEECLGTQLDRQELRQAGSDIFRDNPAINPLLHALKDQGCRLVLLSNTSISHITFIAEQFSLLQCFDDRVLSYEVGSLKPEPAIYEAALGKIHCRPEECFYTDDVPEFVEQGRRFGLQAEVFHDVATLVRQLRERGLQV